MLITHGYPLFYVFTTIFDDFFNLLFVKRLFQRAYSSTKGPFEISIRTQNVINKQGLFKQNDLFKKPIRRPLNLNKRPIPNHLIFGADNF